MFRIKTNRDLLTHHGHELALADLSSSEENSQAAGSIREQHGGTAVVSSSPCMT